MTNDPVTIAAVGDISLGDHLLCLGYGVRSLLKKKDKGFLFKHIRGIFEESDLVFGNLEGVLSDKGLIAGDIDTMVLRGSPEAVISLKSAGFTVLNVANNHTMQHGPDAFNETVEIIKNNSISVAGLKGKEEYFSEPCIKKINGTRIGFLGYSFEKERHYHGDVSYSTGELAEIKNDVRKLKDEMDFVIVSCHWGTELMERPSSGTISKAREIVDAGADVIFGHHPHVFQGIQRYKNSVIFYSLGNFVFDLTWWKPCLRSAIIKVTLIKGLAPDYRIIPVQINKNYQPVPMHSEKSCRFINSVIKASCRIGRDLADESRYFYEADMLEKRLRWKKMVHLIGHSHKLHPSTLRKLFMKKIFA